MMKFIQEFAGSENGAAAAEYVLLLSILGSGIALGAVYFGTQLSNALSARGQVIETCSSTPSSC